MKRILITLCTIIILSACSAKPVYNVENSYVPDGITQKQVEKSIVKALIQKGWKVKSKTDGKIIADINVRDKHTAVIEITYTDKKYSINYVDSTNLKYDVRKNTIHKNYNNWIIYIDRLVQTSLLDYSYDDK